MKTESKHRKLYLFLGTALLVQAITSLVGGLIFLDPLKNPEFTESALRTISDDVSIAYISIFLQVITAVVIIILGVAMYRAAGYISNTIGLVALSLYIFEAVLLALGQVFVFGVVEVSQLFANTPSQSLLDLAKVLYAIKDFTLKINMIPFGIGAALFYYLLFKAQIIPKWLGKWGMYTVTLILVIVPLIAFGIEAPFFLVTPYVPFEFFAGLFIIVVYRKQSIKD